MGLSSHNVEFPPFNPSPCSFIMLCHEKRAFTELLSQKCESRFFSAQVAHNVADKLSEKIDFIMVKASAWHPSIIKQSSRNLENLHSISYLSTDSYKMLTMFLMMPASSEILCLIPPPVAIPYPLSLSQDLWRHET